MIFRHYKRKVYKQIIEHYTQQVFKTLNGVKKQMNGEVKFFNRKKGFGFIKGDDGKEYFVHFSALTEGTMINDNDKVSFESAESDRGLQAQNVSLAQGGSEAPAEEPKEEASEEEASPEEEPKEETKESSEEF